MTRYFADTDWVNTPVSALAREPALQRYVTNLYQHGCGPGMPQGKFALPTSTYTNPIVEAATADLVKDSSGKVTGTLTMPFYQRDSAHQRMPMDATPWQLDTFGCKSGDRIPWSWKWLPAPGNDALLQIVDAAHDTAYDVWMADPHPWVWNYFSAFPAMAANGYAAGIGVGSVFKYHDLKGPSAPPMGRIGSRGCGLHKLAGTITIDALKAKRLDFMSGIYVANPMFGPAMTSPETNWQQAGAGTTLGWHPKDVPRLEHKDPSTLNLGGVTGQAATDAVRALSLPSGMRFAVDRDLNSRLAWLKERGYTGARADTAMTIATAWSKDGHGFGVFETCGPTDRMVIEFEGAMMHPADCAGLGLKVGQYDDLMDSFANEQNTFVVRPRD